MKSAQFTNVQSLNNVEFSELLGFSGAKEEAEKLSEEMIDQAWQEFVEAVLEERLTDEQASELSSLVSNDEAPDEEALSAAKDYIEKIFPGIRDEFSEYMLNFKADLFQNRVDGLAEFYKNDEMSKHSIDMAQDAIDEGKWADALEIVNKLAR